MAEIFSSLVFGQIKYKNRGFYIFSKVYLLRFPKKFKKKNYCDLQVLILISISEKALSFEIVKYNFDWSDWRIPETPISSDWVDGWNGLIQISIRYIRKHS